MMRAVFERCVPSRSCRLLAAGLAVGAMGLSLLAGPAVAAPSWSITSTHLNPYGQKGGVDPYSGSATSFARESGFNAYTIEVANASGSETAGVASIGQAFTCNPNLAKWRNAPTSAVYQWLDNGEIIAGATGSTYTTVAGDAGKALQCEVTATNAGGSSVAMATAAYAKVGGKAAAPIVVGPAPPTALPVPPGNTLSPPSGSASTEGNKLTCYAGPWTGLGGSEPYSYMWYRNGVKIAETARSALSSNEYTLTAVDVATAAAFQCVVTGHNSAGGGVSLASANRDTISPAPAPSPEPPVVATGYPEKATVSGTVTLADRLPTGVTLNAGGSNAGTTGAEAEEVSGAGWACTVLDASEVTCERSDLLAPGASYPPVTLHTYVSAGTAELVTNTASVSGGGATPATASGEDPTTIAPAVPFGIQSFTTNVSDALGNPFTQAGGHPLSATTTFVLNYTTGNNGTLRTAGGSAGDVEVDLPPGFVGNPRSAPTCPLAVGQIPSKCPADTAVGYVNLVLVGTPNQIESGGVVNPFAAHSLSLIYNIEPPPGTPAMFGITTLTDTAFLYGKLRSDGDYGITIGAPALAENGFELLGSSVTFCATGVSTKTVFGSLSSASCAPLSAGANPMLTNPTECSSQAPATTLRVSAYQDPAKYAVMSSYAGAASTAPAYAGGPTSEATPVASSFVTGCDALTEAWTSTAQPTLTFQPENTSADAPSGYNVDLQVPERGLLDPNMLASAYLDNTTVTLPQGVTLSPSAASGLQACSEQQIGYLGNNFPSPSPIRFNEEEAQCPKQSKVGTLEINTPLLEKPLSGSVYLAAQDANPFGSTFAIYLAIDDPETGIVIKLAGEVHADPNTGQLTASFKNNPQLPFSDLKLSFFGGPRAALANPQSCGTFTTTTALTPWSALDPEHPTAAETATPSDRFAIGSGCGGGFAPAFTAGTESTAAGAFSPFSMTMSRNDGEQDVSKVSVTMPPGLLGKIAGIPRCSEAQANAGTCGAESQIGTTTVGAGPGEHPFYLGGRVYLTGPFKGAPFGLSIVVPAIAGPFNLGNVVVRAAINVDPHTAQITVTSDPLPQYVDGVQLRLRKIHVAIDRPGFMFNPTSCAQQHVTGTIGSSQGASEAVSSPFDVGGCQSLPFKPTFSALIHSHHTRKDGAYLHVVVTSGAGQANIAKVNVALPGTLPSRESTLKQACTEAQFAKDPAGCPAGSFVGTATAYTPVLASPLKGPAIFVSHGGAAYPDLDLVLQGEGVTVILTGNTKIHKGITTSTFASVPDVPVSRFDLVLPAGPHSALGANGNLCTRVLIKRKRVRLRLHGHFVRRHGHFVYKPKKVHHAVRLTLRMPTTITGQNGAVVKRSTVIGVTGCGAGKAKGSRARHGRGHHHHAKHGRRSGGRGKRG